MKNIDEFVAEAINFGISNDEFDVWVIVDGVEVTITLHEVLGREENTSFEASYTLEDDTNHPSWEILYDQYKKVMNIL